MKVRTPRLALRKSSLRKILILVMALIGFAVIFGLLGWWEASQRQQATLLQSQADEEARRRREGWIQFEGEWYSPKSEIETMLVMGIDQMEPFADSGSYNNDGQADFFMLAIFDRAEQNMTVLHINRDTMTQIPVLGVTGQKTGSFTGQLALAHTYGSGLQDSCENTVDAVSFLLGGTEIDHYLAMTMSAIPQLNDLVGGVPVTVLDDFSGIDNSLVKGEEITLMGEQALHYVQARGGLEDSTNLNRMQRQQQYFASFMQQFSLLDEETMPGAEEMEQLSADILSDCTINKLSDMLNQYAEYPLLEVQSIAGEVKDGTEYVEYYPDLSQLQTQVLQLFYQKVNN